MNNNEMNPELEKMIAEEILANKGEIVLNADDVQKLKDSSDFIDGMAVDGKLNDLGKLSDQTYRKLKDAHPEKRFTNLLLKMRVSESSMLMMEQMEPLLDFFQTFDEDFAILWGVETNAQITDELRLVMLCGFKEKG